MFCIFVSRWTVEQTIQKCPSGSSPYFWWKLHKSNTGIKKNVTLIMKRAHLLVILPWLNTNIFSNSNNADCQTSRYPENELSCLGFWNTASKSHVCCKYPLTVHSSASLLLFVACGLVSHFIHNILEGRYFVWFQNTEIFLKKKNKNLTSRFQRVFYSMERKFSC